MRHQSGWQTVAVVILLAAPLAYGQGATTPALPGSVAPVRPLQQLVWGESDRLEAPPATTADDATAALLRALGREEDAGARARALEARLLGAEPFDAPAFLEDWITLAPADRQRLVTLVPETSGVDLARVALARLQRQDEDSAALAAVLPDLRAPLEPLFLADLIDEEHSWVDRAWAAYVLGRMGSEGAVPVLEEGIQADHPDYAYACAEALFQLRPPSFAGRWVDLLTHPQPAVQWVALVALTNLGGDEAFGALETIALGGTDHTIGFREQALNGISYWPMAQSVPVLIAALDRERTLQSRAMEHLKALTGLDAEGDPDVWRQWYAGIAPVDGEDGVAPPLMPTTGIPLLDTVDFVPPELRAQGL